MGGSDRVVAAISVNSLRSASSMGTKRSFSCAYWEAASDRDTLRVRRVFLRRRSVGALVRFGLDSTWPLSSVMLRVASAIRTDTHTHTQ